MKLIVLFTLVFSFCYIESALASRKENFITISIPTIEQEASSIWRTINDIQFFEQHGYSVHLPQHPRIDALVAKSKSGKFGSDDYPTIVQLLRSQFYSEGHYHPALTKVMVQQSSINHMLQTLRSKKTNWNWDFKLLDEYEAVFTLYGSGGSYDPDSGVITLFTTEKGNFKNYPSPANTIVHEVVHIGIETSIVQLYQLSHGTKERVVDSIVYLLFNEQMPDYRIQDMGDKRLDKYLKNAEDLINLHTIVKQLN